MSQSQSERAATPATLRESSTDDHSKKRGEAAAELSGRESPAKKQQIERPMSLPSPNLSTIILMGKRRDKKTCEVALDAFSDPTVHGTELRPIQFHYTKFRDWARDVLEIPREESLTFILTTNTGQGLRCPITTKYDFTTVLTKIWNNALRTQPKSFRGDTIQILPLAAAVPAPPQPALEVKKPEELQPEPEQRPEAPEPEPEQEPEEAQPEPKSPEHIDLTGDEEVLPADAFLQLVREAETPDDDRLIPGEIEEPGADEKLYKFDIRTLKKALCFWNTNIGEDGKCKVKGMKTSLHIWQIQGGYLMITNACKVSCNGLLIGLDVGFGKTMLVLLYVLGKAVIWTLEREVQDEWKSGNPKNHLGQKQKGRCPTQDKHMVQCPCSWTKTERRILQLMADLPSLIICPPNLRDTWLEEAERSFEDFEKEDSFLKFYYFFGQNTKGNDFRDGSRLKKILEETKGVVIIEDDEEYIDVGNGRASDIFFTSNRMAEKLVKKYQAAGVNAAFGTFIMDEMQKYRGSTKSTTKSESEDDKTIPFKALDLITAGAWNPVSVIALCGTIAEEGYTFWKQLVEHFRQQWQIYDHLLNKATPPDFLNSSDRITKSYKELIRECAEDPTPTASKKAKAAEIRHFLQPMTFAIRQNEMWRGKTLNPLPQAHQRTIAVTPLADEVVKNCLTNIMANVDKLVNEELTRKKKDWAKKKGKAKQENRPFDLDEPTKQDVIEHQVGAERPKGAWHELSRACSFPYLAVLTETGVVKSGMLDSSECQYDPVAIAKRIDQDPQKLHADEKEFEDWEFYRHRKLLKANSPKFAELEQLLIPDLINDEDPDTRPDKDDPCQKRYAVVFCTHTITAVLIWFFLITNKELCKKIQPILFTSSISIERRQEIMKEVMKGRPDGRCRILIATTEIAAEGFNLQRVNNVWVMELPNTPSKFLQAIGRVRRTGQLMKIKIVRLFDKENLFERTSLNTLDSKIVASKLIYNAAEP